MVKIIYVTEDKAKKEGAINKIVKIIIIFDLVVLTNIILFNKIIAKTHQFNIEPLLGFLWGGSLLAIITCYTYFYIYKEYDFFIIATICLNYMLMGFYIKYINNIGVISLNKTNELLFVGYLIRMIALYQIINPNKVVKEFFLNYRVLGSILLIIVQVLVTNVEVYLYEILGFLKYFDMIKILKNGTIVFNFYIIYLFIQKSKKENNNMLAIISFSLNCFLLGRVMLLRPFSDFHNVVFIINEFITLIGYFVISIEVFRDLIKKVKDNQSLKEQLEIFYEMADKNELDYIALTDLEGNSLYQNKKYIEFLDNMLLGFKEGYMPMDKIKSIHSKVIKDFDKLDKEIRESLKYNTTYTKLVETNNNKIFELNIQLIKSSSNKHFIINHFSDKTEQYINTQKLIRNEQKLSTINRNIREFIVMFNFDGRIKYVNPYTIEKLGYNLSEVIDKSYEEFINNHNKLKEYVQLDNSELSVEVELLDKEGNAINTEGIVSKIIEDDKVKGYIMVGKDINKKKELESLKEKYAEVTEYNRIREEFFANISHEVRTPLNIIHSSMQLLKSNREYNKDKFVETFDRYEKSITQNCYRLLRLVNNILSLTSMETNEIKIKLLPVEIISIIEETTMSVIPYVESKNINIIFDTNVEELYIKCDIDRIEKAVLNLIANAIKFTESNGEIIVECIKENKNLKIRVKDNGIGINYTMREFIFERFAQVDKSLNRTTEGSGIGLALVKGIANAHGGTVFLEETDVGASFIFSIPIIDVTIEDSIIERENVRRRLSDRVLIELSDIY